MSEYGQEVGKAADRAFSSPTNLTAQRVGRRISPQHTVGGSGGKSVASGRSRRSASVITTADEAKLFDQMISATSVHVRNKKSEGLFRSGNSTSLFPSFSMDAQAQQTTTPASPGSSNGGFSADYSKEEHYFSPGGALSIETPGRVQVEKERNPIGLTVPSLEEKKSADGDPVVMARRRPLASPPAPDAMAAHDAAVNLSVDTSMSSRPSDYVMPLDTLNEVESEDRIMDTTTHMAVSATDSEWLPKTSPSHGGEEESHQSVVVVETVESGDSDSRDPIQHFRRGEKDEDSEGEDPVNAFRTAGSVTDDDVFAMFQAAVPPLPKTAVQDGETVEQQSDVPQQPDESQQLESKVNSTISDGHTLERTEVDGENKAVEDGNVQQTTSSEAPTLEAHEDKASEAEDRSESKSAKPKDDQVISEAPTSEGLELQIDGTALVPDGESHSVQTNTDQTLLGAAIGKRSLDPKDEQTLSEAPTSEGLEIQYGEKPVEQSDEQQSISRAPTSEELELQSKARTMEQTDRQPPISEAPTSEGLELQYEDKPDEQNNEQTPASEAPTSEGWELKTERIRAKENDGKPPVSEAPTSEGLEVPYEWKDETDTNARNDDAKDTMGMTTKEMDQDKPPQLRSGASAALSESPTSEGLEVPYKVLSNEKSGAGLDAPANPMKDEIVPPLKSVAREAISEAPTSEGLEVPYSVQSKDESDVGQSMPGNAVDLKEPHVESTTSEVMSEAPTDVEDKKTPTTDFVKTTISGSIDGLVATVQEKKAAELTIKTEPESSTRGEEPRGLKDSPKESKFEGNPFDNSIEPPVMETIQEDQSSRDVLETKNSTKQTVDDSATTPDDQSLNFEDKTKPIRYSFYQGSGEEHQPFESVSATAQTPVPCEQSTDQDDQPLRPPDNDDQHKGHSSYQGSGAEHQPPESLSAKTQMDQPLRPPDNGDQYNRYSFYQTSERKDDSLDLLSDEPNRFSFYRNSELPPPKPETGGEDSQNRDSLFRDSPPEDPPLSLPVDEPEQHPDLHQSSSPDDFVTHDDEPKIQGTDKEDAASILSANADHVEGDEATELYEESKHSALSCQKDEIEHQILQPKDEEVQNRFSFYDKVVQEEEAQKDLISFDDVEACSGELQEENETQMPLSVQSLSHENSNKVQDLNSLSNQGTEGPVSQSNGELASESEDELIGRPETTVETKDVLETQATAALVDCVSALSETEQIRKSGSSDLVELVPQGAAVARHGERQGSQVDPCGIASATLENIGSFISHSTVGDESEIERNGLCSTIAASDQQERLSRMVESLSTSLTGVALPDEQAQEDNCLPIWDSDACSPMWDTDTDLRADDESFQILAHKTISFLQQRLDSERGIITIHPLDREEAKNLYPSGMRSEFLDALRYRLSVAPPKPVTALDMLVFKCQTFGLDEEGDKNPVIAAESVAQYPRIFPVVYFSEHGKDPDTSWSTKTHEVAVKRQNPFEERVPMSLVVSLSDSSMSGEATPIENTVATSSEKEETKLVDHQSESLEMVSSLAEDANKEVKKKDSSKIRADSGIIEQDVPPPFPATTIHTTSVVESNPSDGQRNAEPTVTLLPTKEDHPLRVDESGQTTSSAFDVQNIGNTQLQKPGLFLSGTAIVHESRSLTPAQPNPPLDNVHQNTPLNDLESTTAPPTYSSKTDTALTPEALPNRAPNPFLANQYHVQRTTMVANGPPTEITHQSHPLSAVSGLDSSVGGTDLKVDTNAMHRLGAEIQEAKRLAETSESPETAAFWRNHTKDLQAKYDALQRNIESSSRAMNQQTTAENPAEQPKGLQFEKQVPPVGDYFAMEENIPYRHHHADSTQSQMQSMEYESRMVDVIAPADLPGGYHFEAEIEGQRFLATVPAGGVQQGETFTCYMRELNSVAIDIPVGYWKDNMCHMCKHGLCHPTLWHGLFCPLISLGQITHRLQLDFLGRPRFPGTYQKYTNRFIMLFVTIAWASMNAALIYAGNYKWMRAMDITASDWTAFALVNVGMYGFAVFVAQSTRSSIREKFMIREERCYDLEDVMCASTCLPCTVAQMSRHTANYNDYEAVCCSKTGLPDGVKVMHSANVKGNGDFLV